jgi:2-hydroxychromene-2-carboxylate isomerase
MVGSLDFYFFYGSIHSYLSVMRIEPLASAAHIEVRWRPFNLWEILVEQNNTAFTKNDVKMNYFWHDLERRRPSKAPVRRSSSLSRGSRSSRTPSWADSCARRLVR